MLGCCAPSSAAHACTHIACTLTLNARPTSAHPGLAELWLTATTTSWALSVSLQSSDSHKRLRGPRHAKPGGQQPGEHARRCSPLSGPDSQQVGHAPPEQAGTARATSSDQGLPLLVRTAPKMFRKHAAHSDKLGRIRCKLQAGHRQKRAWPSGLKPRAPQLWPQWAWKRRTARRAPRCKATTMLDTFTGTQAGCGDRQRGVASCRGLGDWQGLCSAQAYSRLGSTGCTSCWQVAKAVKLGCGAWPAPTGCAALQRCTAHADVAAAASWFRLRKL